MPRGKTVAAFEFDLRKFADSLGIEFGTAIRKVVLDIHRAVSDLSPVDTGRFRASWGIAQFKIPTDPGAPPVKKGEKVSIDSEQRKRTKGLNDEPYTLWYIYNNLPYAQSLEDGHSDQAPEGILDLALATVEAELDDAFGNLF